jgi:hypothetical protein
VAKVGGAAWRGSRGDWKFRDGERTQCEGKEMKKSPLVPFIQCV